MRSTRQNIQNDLYGLKINEQRLRKLNAISTTLLGTFNLKHLLLKIGRMISDLMLSDFTVVYLKDPENPGFLILAASDGINRELKPKISHVQIGSGFYGKVAASGHWKISRNSEEWSAAEEFRKSGYNVQIAVPLIIKEQINGLICVGMRVDTELASHEISLLTTVAAEIAVAIDNARLYEEQRGIARRLSATEGRYRRLFENASDAIWVHDFEGIITTANPAAGELIGFVNADELVGKDVRSFLTTEGLITARKVRQALLRHEPFEQPYELHLIRVDSSEIILMVSTSLVKHSHEPSVFEHVARDVTKERRMQDNLRHYVQEITKSQEDERNRIARDLHDETAQDLYAITRQLDNYLRNRSNNINSDTTVFLRNLGEQIKKASQGVRRFSQDLRPPMLDNLGLLPSLRWLTALIKERLNVKTEIKVVGNERRLAPHVELAIFRIVQEGLRNIDKHACATRIDVEITFTVDMVTISIKDNGKGFELVGDLGDLPRGGRLGLVGMQERARLLGGTINIHSELEKGTTILIKVPVSNSTISN